MALGDETVQPAGASGAGGNLKQAAPQTGGGISEERALYDRFLEAIEDDGRFPLEAYRFLQEGLEFTVHRVHGQRAMNPVPVPPGQPDPRHVSGEQLCMGLRDLALSRWGRLAKTVFNTWGIHTTTDFGAMVFVLVQNGFLRKTDDDQLQDFFDVFEFVDLEHLYELPRGPLPSCDFDYSGGACYSGTGSAS